MQRLIAAIGLFMTMTTPGLATTELSITGYEQMKGNPSLNRYMQGVLSGIGWTNAVVKEKTGRALFCAPSDMVLLDEKAISILDEYLRHAPILDRNSDEVSLKMLFALMDKFPCPDQ